MADTDQKTEEPTPQRRREAREKGQTAVSQELSQGILLLAGVSVLWLSGSVADGLKSGLSRGLGDLRKDLTEQELPLLSGVLFRDFVSTVGPLLGVVFLTGLFVGVAQSGINVSFKALAPDIGRLSPLKGWNRIWSSRSVMRTVTSLFKLAAVGAITAILVSGRLGILTTTGRGTVKQAVHVGWDTAVALGLAVAGAMSVVGVLDFLYQRWKHEQDLKMTRQEVKDDQKQEEGDPMIRARLRKLQRERATNKMLADVPDATVVVTNPTHVSVALRYERGTMAAPVVVAKGADALALRIREIARENDVPVIERKPIARALYGAVEVGEEIPIELYQAVAEILTYLHRLGMSR